MNPDTIYELIKICLTTALALILPLALSALVVGTLVGLLQTITSIQEQSLTFIPKLLVSALVLWFSAPWMLEQLGGLTILFFQRAGQFVP